MKLQSKSVDIGNYPVKDELSKWVTQIAQHCEAETIYWCDGTQKEYDGLCNLLVQKGTLY